MCEVPVDAESPRANRRQEQPVVCLPELLALQGLASPSAPGVLLLPGSGSGPAVPEAVI